MNLSFNSDGNLHETVELSLEEFQQQFGTNMSRIEKIKAATQFFKKFSSCGCKAVYIGGSFVSKKKDPEDIDLLFDLTEADSEKLEWELPELLSHNHKNKIGTIRRNLKCHIFTFDKRDQRLLDILLRDRKGYPKGMVKINLQNEFNYD
jgi:hypothetical protein